MKIFPEKKSDSEFIEGIREKIERPKWGAIFQYGMAVFFLLMFFIFWTMSHRLHEIFPEKYAEMLTPGFFVGIILGCSAGFMIFFAMVCMHWGPQEDSVRRTERLLIHFHDRLKESNCQPGAGGNE